MTRLHFQGRIFVRLVCFMAVWSLMPRPLYAKTTISITPVGPYSFPVPSEIVGEVEDKSDLNGPIIANSMALANITGYPVGKAHIGSFPHFELGISLGAGFTNMRYFNDDDPASSNGSLPGITPNPVLHFGFGLAGGLDVIGKVFVISRSMIDFNIETDIATLTHYNILSVGGKLRYNIVKKQTLIPFIFNFGGVTLSLGADAMYGEIKVNGEYDADFGNITIDDGGGPADYPVEFSGIYDARVLWGIISVTGQAVAYFDIMYLFSLYSGFGLSANFGYFKMSFDGNGILTETSGPNNVGTLVFQSTNRYSPYYLIPTYLIGLEMNLFVLKLTGETMVNLYNLRDVNAQIGVRIQI